MVLASVAALTEQECEIHIGEIDIKFKYYWAKVAPKTHRGKSLKEAVDSTCMCIFMYCNSFVSHSLFFG